MASYAKKVYSFDLGRVVDRTKNPHPYGEIDIDFRFKKAENPRARKWTYACTVRTLKGAMKEIERMSEELGRGGEYRIVDVSNGKILKKVKR